MERTLLIFAQLPDFIKKSLKLSVDLLAILGSYFLAFFVYLPAYTELNSIDFVCVFIVVLVWIIAATKLKVYAEPTRFSTLSTYISIVKVSLLLAVTTTVVFYWQYKLFLFENILFFSALNVNISVGVRLLIRQGIRRERNKNKKLVIIYGTSDTAIDLHNALSFGQKYKTAAFLNQFGSEKFQKLAGLPVIKDWELPKKYSVDDLACIIVAFDQRELPETKKMVKQFTDLGYRVKYGPSLNKALDYEVQLRSVSPEDLLTRSSPSSFSAKFVEYFNEKIVLVTGAGGSIGSEISRQLMDLEPSMVIFIEANELALYNLREEIDQTSVISELALYKLGSIQDKKFLQAIFDQYKIDIIFHAAAYKHVPIVEENIIEALKNNVFGTLNLVQLAKAHRIPTFTLVSTDKAVRPTNIMGATKRLAELICQSFLEKSETSANIVRFGNVLGSSGSVIPKFKQQIESGGPVTVTDENINRYFMSISEAAYLVINTAKYRSEADVFLLNMGAPVKILELAKTMILLHGLKPILVSEGSTVGHEDDELPIVFTGLRPGEKMYEELLVGSDAFSTDNPMIFRAKKPLLNLKSWKRHWQIWKKQPIYTM